MTRAMKWTLIIGGLVTGLFFVGVVGTWVGQSDDTPVAAATSSTTEAVSTTVEQTTTTEQATTTTAPPTTTTTTRPPTTTTTESYSLEVRETAFLLTMRDFSSRLDNLTWVDVSDDDSLLEWGYLICESMGDVGVESTLDAALAGMSAAYGSSWNSDDVMLVPYGIGAATGLCPEHEQAVIDWTSS